MPGCTAPQWHVFSGFSLLPSAYVVPPLYAPAPTPLSNPPVPNLFQGNRRVRPWVVSDEAAALWRLLADWVLPPVTLCG